MLDIINFTSTEPKKKFLIYEHGIASPLPDTIFHVYVAVLNYHNGEMFDWAVYEGALPCSIADSDGPNRDYYIDWVALEGNKVPPWEVEPYLKSICNYKPKDIKNAIKRYRF